MSTHNIGFYEEISKIITKLSSNIIKYAPYFFCWYIPRTGHFLNCIFPIEYISAEKAYEQHGEKTKVVAYVSIKYGQRGTTGLVVRASNSGSGDPGSILGRVGVLFP